MLAVYHSEWLCWYIARCICLVYRTKMINFWTMLPDQVDTILRSSLCCVCHVPYFHIPASFPTSSCKEPSPIQNGRHIVSDPGLLSDSINGVTFSVTFMRDTETRYGGRASFSFFLWRREGSVNPKKMLKKSWCILHFHFYFLIFAMPAKWLHLLTVSSSIQ